METKIRTTYEKLLSKFETDKKYTPNEIFSGLRDLGLADKGLIGKIKGLYNFHSIHGKDGDQSLLFRFPSSLEWVYFQRKGKHYAFESGFEDM